MGVQLQLPNPLLLSSVHQTRELILYVISVYSREEPLPNIVGVAYGVHN
jgi:hypothetical protein